MNGSAQKRRLNMIPPTPFRSAKKLKRLNNTIGTPTPTKKTMKSIVPPRMNSTLDCNTWESIQPLSSSKAPSLETIPDHEEDALSDISSISR